MSSPFYLPYDSMSRGESLLVNLEGICGVIAVACNPKSDPNPEHLAALMWMAMDMITELQGIVTLKRPEVQS